MKKKILAVAFMLCLAVPSIFAFGIGIQGGSDVYSYANGYYYGGTSLDLTFKFDSIPLLFTLGLPSFEPFALGIAGDYWIVNPAITGGNGWSLNWYVGAGIFANFYIPRNDFYVGFGGRVPIGINLFFLRRVLEAYLQIAPGIKLDVDNGVYPHFVCPVNYGLRIWIN